MTRLTLVLPLILVVSCSRTAQNGPLPTETFARAYAAILEAGVTADTVASSAQRADSILRAMDIQPERFRASIEYCNRDVRRWGPVLDSVVQYLNRKRLEESAR